MCFLANLSILAFGLPVASKQRVNHAKFYNRKAAPLSSRRAILFKIVFYIIMILIILVFSRLKETSYE